MEAPIRTATGSVNGFDVESFEFEHHIVLRNFSTDRVCRKPGFLIRACLLIPVVDLAGIC